MLRATTNAWLHERGAVESLCQSPGHNHSCRGILVGPCAMLVRLKPCCAGFPAAATSNQHDDSLVTMLTTTSDSSLITSTVHVPPA